VADDKAVLRHHQMRIAAKWLRYTLETFAPAYEDGLKQYISRLKKLQDVLGEMHDCDVWIEALLERLRWRCGPALAALLQDRQTTRSSLYGQLVTMWKDWEMNGLLWALETDLLAAIRPRSKRIDLSGLPPSAKIALFADVHGNLPALEAVMEDAAERGAEVFFNAGDCIGWGPFDNEVVQYLRDPSIITVLGNYDQGILAARMGGGAPYQGGDSLKRKVAAHALHNINDASISFLLGLPEQVRFEIGGMRFLITHASPASILEPVTQSTDPARLEKLAKVADADVVVLGHTHRCMDLAVGQVRFLNPGSVGLPVGGDPRACYALLDTQSLLIEFVRVQYDLMEVADRIVAVGLPKRLAQMYLAGRGTDEPEERAHARSQLELVEKLELVEGEAQRYGHLDGHSLFVRSTAVQLFDHLQGEHGLGAQERYWLECGALLHDIGWSQSGIDHNLASFNMVMSDHQLPLDERERLIVASLTRYHRKGLPRKDHGNYKVLSKRERGTVDVLAGILRVADGLDVRHAHDVRIVGCWADPHVIIVEVEDPLSHRYEIEAGRKKGRLLEKAFDRRLAIQ
jgi:putative phosphoesterase